MPASAASSRLRSAAATRAFELVFCSVVEPVESDARGQGGPGFESRQPDDKDRSDGLMVATRFRLGRMSSVARPRVATQAAAKRPTAAARFGPVL